MIYMSEKFIENAVLLPMLIDRNNSCFINIKNGEIYSGELPETDNANPLFYEINEFYFKLINVQNLLICKDNDDVPFAVLPDDITFTDITQKQIEVMNSFGETDYKKVLNDAKQDLSKGVCKNIRFLKIQRIQYGSMRFDETGHYPTIAVITDENNVNITIADYDNLYDLIRSDILIESRHMFYDIKPSDLIGNTLCAYFYIHGKKIYANPVAVITNENIICFG
jgi:hypothetical protein